MNKIITIIIFVITISSIIWIIQNDLSTKKDNEIRSYDPSPTKPFSENPIALNMTSVLCTSTTKCFDTETRVTENGYVLTAKPINATVNLSVYQRGLDGRMLSAVKQFCNSDICFEQNSDKLYVSMSITGNAYLDIHEIYEINKRFEVPLFDDIDNDHKSEFIFPMKTLGFDISDIMKKEPFNFRIIVIPVDPTFKFIFPIDISQADCDEIGMFEPCKQQLEEFIEINKEKGIDVKGECYYRLQNNETLEKYNLTDTKYFNYKFIGCENELK